MDYPNKAMPVYARQSPTHKFSFCITYVSKVVIGNNHAPNTKPEVIVEVVLKYNPYNFFIWIPGFFQGSLIFQCLQFYTCGVLEKHCDEFL